MPGTDWLRSRGEADDQGGGGVRGASGRGAELGHATRADVAAVYDPVGGAACGFGLGEGVGSMDQSLFL